VAVGVGVGVGVDELVFAAAIGVPVSSAREGDVDPVTVAVTHPVDVSKLWSLKATHAVPFHQSRELPPPRLQTTTATEENELPGASATSTYTPVPPETCPVVGSTGYSATVRAPTPEPVAATAWSAVVAVAAPVGEVETAPADVVDPAGGAGGVSAAPGLTVIDSVTGVDAWGCGEAESVAFTVKVVVPVVDGLPTISPDAYRARPAGKALPVTRTNEYVGVPPVAASTWSYVAPTVPSGSPVVVMTTGVPFTVNVAGLVTAVVVVDPTVLVNTASYFMPFMAVVVAGVV
jgi:hypothetical protein